MLSIHSTPYTLDLADGTDISVDRLGQSLHVINMLTLHRTCTTIVACNYMTLCRLLDTSISFTVINR